LALRKASKYIAKNTLAMVPNVVPTMPPNRPTIGAATRGDTFQFARGRQLIHSE
jgi:hypothetical protein